MKQYIKSFPLIYSDAGFAKCTRLYVRIIDTVKIQGIQRIRVRLQARIACGPGNMRISDNTNMRRFTTTGARPKRSSLFSVESNDVVVTTPDEKATDVKTKYNRSNICKCLVCNG